MKALPDNQTNRDAVIDAAPASQPASSPATQPTKELTLDLGNKVAMKLVLIPSGKFTMGSSSEEQVRASKDVKPNDLPLYRFKDESPQHEVTISQSFYMAVSHVTVDQFAAFVKDSDYQTDAEKDRSSDGVEIENGRDAVKRMDGLSWRKPSFDQGGDHPVVQVSWNDAKAFCDWLSKKTGKTVTLPTEAQFEYACRAGTKTAYPWGDNPDDGKGWASCRDQSFRKKLPGEPAETFFRWDDGFIFTSPVGSFKPNAFGLYDMIGNAFQWCSDWYDEGYYANAPKTDPQGPTSGAYHVLRGSGWGAYKFRCRSANRFCVNPPGRTDFYGFRVVVDVE
jgi:formylglycine-generating enzyme required for sulfatase activity